MRWRWTRYHRRRAVALAVLIVVGVFISSAITGVPKIAGLGHNDASDANPACPWVGETWKTPTERADEVIARMTSSQMISMLSGTSGWTFNSSGYTGLMPGVRALCIPTLKLKDGPNGVRTEPDTSFPGGEVLASTWDPSMAGAYGRAAAREFKAAGAQVVLGPTLNLVRDSRWGRVGETFGEDPLLAGELGAAYVNGVQSEGEEAEVKHFAAYNQETGRETTSDNVSADDRTYHELYMRQFLYVVQHSNPAGIMCSYNYNSPYLTTPSTHAAQTSGTPYGLTASSCSSSYLLTGLRDLDPTWKGWFGSDWFASYPGTTLASVNAGMNLQEPGTGNANYSATLTSDYRQGLVTKAQLAGLVEPILVQDFKFGYVEHPPTGGTVEGDHSTEADLRTAVQTAEQGTVLLQNDGNLLPLTADKLKTIQIFGQPQTSFSYSPTGSGNSPAIAQAIQSAAGSGVSVYDDDNTAPTSGTASEAKNASAAIVFVAKNQDEGGDAQDLSLSSGQNALVSAVAANNKNTIVILTTPGAVAPIPWLSSVRAVLEGWYGGEGEAAALASILFGKVDPSGHLPMTWPTSVAKSPASTTQQWPGVNGKVDYSEGLDMGYRWYNATGTKPQFAFGYGLSYTSFTYSDLRLSAASGTSGQNVSVSLTVKNTGGTTGTAVPQIYVSKPDTIEPSPPNELVGFQRVQLAPGASRRISVTVPASQLSVWDEASQSYVVQDGSYTFSAGPSAETLPLSASYAVSATTGPIDFTVQGASTATAATVMPDSKITLTAHIANASNFTFRGARLSATTTAGAGWRVASSTLPAAIAAGGSATGTITLTVPATAPSATNQYVVWLNGTVHGTPVAESWIYQVNVSKLYSSLAEADNVVGSVYNASPNAASLDPAGFAFSADALNAAGIKPGSTITFSGGGAQFPTAQPGTPNAVRAAGQLIKMSGSAQQLAIVGVAVNGTQTGTMTVNYADGTSQQVNVTFNDWWANSAAPGTTVIASVASAWAKTAIFQSGAKPTAHTVGLYGAEIPIASNKPLASITLPDNPNLVLFTVAPLRSG